MFLTCLAESLTFKQDNMLGTMWTPVNVTNTLSRASSEIKTKLLTFCSNKKETNTKEQKV